MNSEPYNWLAALLSYPDEPTVHAVRSLQVNCPPAASQLSLFAERTRSRDLRAFQELFIQTFDLSPLCSLEMGWHLFGENYDRGLLLVKIRQLLRACRVPEGTELPDHLTYALRLIPRMERAEAEYFVEAIVLPALVKMIGALQGKDNPYEHVLLAVSNLLHADFPEVRAANAGSAELRVLV